MREITRGITEITCERCGNKVPRRTAEVNRSIRKGMRLFCGPSCSGKEVNEEKRSKPLTLECPCGKLFDTDTGSKSARHCSAGCASHFSMTPERREAQRKGGLVTCADNGLSIEGILRKREAWKYVLVEKELIANKRKFQFEYPIGNGVFDLLLLDTKTIVEFDGPYHKKVAEQIVRDAEKDAIAIAYGFKIVRKEVAPASVIPVEAIAGL